MAHFLTIGSSPLMLPQNASKDHLCLHIVDESDSKLHILSKYEFLYQGFIGDKVYLLHK